MQVIFNVVINNGIYDFLYMMLLHFYKVLILYTRSDFEFLAKDQLSKTTLIFYLGPRGSGKSSLVKHWLSTVNRKNNHVLNIQICKNTKPKDLFGPLMKYMEKKSREECQPINGKQLILFLDDIELGEKNMLSEPVRYT